MAGSLNKKKKQKPGKGVNASGSGTGMSTKSFGGGGIIPQIEKEKVLKSQGLDLKLLDRISEEYILSPNSFNDIDKVETKLALLGEQYSVATNAQTKSAIKEIIDKYELQQKRLLKEEAVDKARTKSRNDTKTNGTSTPNTPMTYEINDKDELVPQAMGENGSTPSGNDCSKNNPSVSNLTTPKRNQRTKPNVSPMSNTPKNVYKNTDSTKRKLNNSNESEVENSVTKKSTWNVTNHREVGNAVTILFNDKSKSKENKGDHQRLTPPNMQEIENEKYIRIRMQFKAKTKEKNEAIKHDKIISDLLYNFMKGVKRIDSKASLLPWKAQSTHRPLNGNELRLHVGEKVNEYIDIPELKENLIEGKTYYQNGIRLKTELSTYEFTERWSNMRYGNTEESKGIEWFPLKPAEMQRAENSYPIGYFVGTTERGDYRTINKEISKSTKTHTEVSFQFVNQSGVTPKIWQFAREQAERANEDPRSKVHKRTKFKYAPSALTVYVSDRSSIKEARRILIEKYGKLENGLWPVMPDGSRIRFVPILFGNVNGNSISKKKQQVFNHLYDQLVLQSSSKAGEILLDLEMWDLFSRKEYMNGSTLEEVIHGLTSTAKPGIPIFKHITRKWSRNPNEENYEVAVAPSMLREAQETLRTIQPAMKRKFGIIMNSHFNPPAGQRLYKNVSRRDEFDPDVEDFLIASTTNDKYSRVLIEGMDFMSNDNSKVSTIQKPTRHKAMLIQEGHQNKADSGSNRDLKETTESFEIMEVKSTNEKETATKDDDIMSTFSNLTKNSKKGDRTNWEEVTIADAYENCIPANESQIKIIEEKITMYNITMQEIELWKNMNSDEYTKLTEGDSTQEFTILMHVIEGVIDSRRDMQESNIEVENYAKLLDSESKKALEVEALGKKSSQNNKANPQIYTSSTSTSNTREDKTGKDVGRGG